MNTRMQQLVELLAEVEREEYVPPRIEIIPPSQPTRGALTDPEDSGLLARAEYAKAA